jgi:hypothetical protein
MHRQIGVEFMYEALSGVYLVSVVVLFWRHTITASLLLGAGLGIWLWRYRNKADAAAMVGAALLGTPSEIICVKYGVWTYNAPGLFMGIPVWIPLIWASLFCLFRRIAVTLHSLADKIWPGRKSLSRKIVFGLLAGVIIVYYIMISIAIIRSIAIVYTVIMLITVIFWHKERDILIFITGGMLGTFGEYICMQQGFWNYHFPHFISIGLPVSLPMAWGLSAIIIGRIAKIWEVDAKLLK